MMSRSNLILTTSPRSQPAKKPHRTANIALRQRPLYGRKQHYHTVKERDSETGLYYYGARYLDGRTSRWLSGDPAMGEYVPEAPVSDEAKKRNQNLPGMGGVFNYVNLHMYHYAGNNPVKYTDPDGMAAWDETVSWKPALEETFREKFSKNAIRIANNAIKNREVIDCADVALTALVDTAQEMGLKISFDYYDSSEGRYQTVSSSDPRFNSKEEFLSFVNTNMGSLTLLDHRTTRDTKTITHGDLVMFDLRSDNNPSYSGHTVIVTGIIDAQNLIVGSVQGHIGSMPTIENYQLGTPLYGAQPQYRSFRLDRLFK